MPRGSKSSYTSKQKRMAENVEEGYEKRGVGGREAERRAWATVNKETGGGRKRSPARKKPSSRKGTTSGTTASRTTKTSGTGTRGRKAAARRATPSRAASTRAASRTTSRSRTTTRKK